MMNIDEQIKAWGDTLQKRQAAEREAELQAEIERLTAERDALRAACRATLEVHGREFKFDEDGKYKGEFDCDCDGCEQARDALAQVEE